MGVQQVELESELVVGSAFRMRRVLVVADDDVGGSGTEMRHLGDLQTPRNRPPVAGIRFPVAGQNRRRAYRPALRLLD